MEDEILMRALDRESERIADQLARAFDQRPLLRDADGNEYAREFVDRAIANLRAAAQQYDEVVALRDRVGREYAEAAEQAEIEAMVATARTEFGDSPRPREVAT